MTKARERPKSQRACLCPYCEGELEETLFPFCKTCSVVLRYCRHCKIPVARKAVVCPQCGAPVEGEERKKA